MFVRAASGSILGVDAQTVVVEAHRGRGIPGLHLIGLAKGAVREATTRVRSAVVASKLNLGSYRLVANLLPAELPKEASTLDLALAVSLLAAVGEIPAKSLEGRRFFGELSLGGRLEPARGACLVADLARRSGDHELLLPASSAAEAGLIPGIDVIPIDSLQAAVGHLRGTTLILPVATCATRSESLADAGPCLSEVRGQDAAKRALEVAAAGGHNLLLLGPPGAGKTMLAKRLPALLPSLSVDEAIEVTRIHSAAGQLRATQLTLERPFRAPHHTSSDVALCGGGSIPRPGEITLAHRGVLFLDELPEFSRRALESLREPLEEGTIQVSRAAMAFEFPASVLLIAAMNPCPCGYFRGDFPKSQRRVGAGQQSCVCSLDQIRRYRSKISGPLLDRIDMHVLVDRVPFAALYGGSVDSERSSAVAERVSMARQRQAERFGPGQCNAAMSAKTLREQVPLSESQVAMLSRSMSDHGLSMRALGRVMKVARSIADLEGSAEVGEAHLTEALGLRLLDRVPVPQGRS